MNDTGYAPATGPVGTDSSTFSNIGRSQVSPDLETGFGVPEHRFARVDEVPYAVASATHLVGSSSALDVVQNILVLHQAAGPQFTLGLVLMVSYPGYENSPQLVTDPHLLMAVRQAFDLNIPRMAEPSPRSAVEHF